MIIKDLVIKNPKVNHFVLNAGDKITAAEQRLLIGVTALATQPIIDLNNKKADEETRILSACRSLGKIIAATTSGVIVRKLCISKIEKTFSKDKLELIIKNKNAVTDTSVRKFNNFMGSAAALGVMLFTNFLWDAPVTKKLTNFFYDLVSKNKETK